MTALELLLLSVAVLAALALPVARQEKGKLLAEELKQPVLDPEVARRELGEFIRKKVPRLELPGGAAAWRSQGDRLRKRLLGEVVYRGVPREWVEGEPHVVWGETLSGPGYRIRKLRYEAVPGLWIPALLYEPDGLRGRVPAILNVNGHVGEPAGKAIEYEQVRCINLAKRGMLALHPEWLNCGELFHPEYRHNRLAYLDLCGRSGLAVFYLTMRRGLDLLEAHPRADPRRLAMTGLSGGGWQTIWLSALDLRVAATAPNAGYIGMPERTLHPGDIGDLEQNPADMLRLADYPHLTALLAPRHALLIYNERDDCCFQTARARPSVYEPVLPFYGLANAAARFQFHNNTVPGTHNYDQDNREQFYRFLNGAFRPEGERRDAEIPCPGEVHSFEALRAGVPSPGTPGDAGKAGETNRGFGGLAEELLPSLPRSRWPEGNPAEARRWQAASRRRLRGLLRYPGVQVSRVRQVSRVPDTRLTTHLTHATHSASIVRRLLCLGDSWTVPVVEVRGESPVGTALVVSEQGRAESAGLAEELLARGLRVLCVDLTLFGECDPPGVARSQHAMMMGAVGERLLGIQAAQLLAVADWAAREFRTPAVTLAGVGRAGAMVAVAAAALGGRRVEELIAVGLPASLKLLIEERVEYEACPELFRFGLLERFDVRELLGMSVARRIWLRHPAGSRERAHQELDSLGSFLKELGSDVKIEA